MSYKYKEEILLDIGPEPNCNYGSESNRYYDKIDELDHVYTQAAKADEYEAKVKAFDEIMKVFENNFDAADSIAKLKVFTEVENAYIESGESDAKK